jgi:Apea-like HEPN
MKWRGTTLEEQDFDELPLYGCLTGFTLPVENFEICPGLLLRRTVVDVFGGGDMFFVAPRLVPARTGGPFGDTHQGRVLLRDSNKPFQAQVELLISSALPDCSTLPTTVAWLVASLLRLQIDAPVRLPMLGRIAFGAQDTPGQIAEVLGLETAPRHWGYPPKEQPVKARLEDLLWLRRCLPIALDLYQDDRFQRAYSIYDEALSSPRKELVAVLIWTAIEILFDASSEQHKTRAICEGVSSWIGRGDNRDHIYNLTRNLYLERGRVVHVGRKIAPADFIQALSLCRTVFRTVESGGVLPPSRLRVVAKE